MNETLLDAADALVANANLDRTASGSLIVVIFHEDWIEFRQAMTREAAAIEHMTACAEGRA